MPLVLRTAVGRTTPLTNTELDSNFTYLESYTDTKVSIVDYNYLTIRSNLNGAPTSGGNRGLESNLDVRYLQGNEPNSVLPSATNKSSIVARDGNGDFTARNITASSFEGRSTTSGVAEQATKLQNTRKINDVDFDGTAAITIFDKTKLPLTTQFAANAVTIGVRYIIDVVGTTNWVAMGAAANTAGLIFLCNAVGTGTGTCSTVMLDKLNLAASTTARASVRLNHGTAPTAPLNGDVWTTTVGQFNQINGSTKTVAYTDSNISGTSSNITGIAAIANGGTGKSTVDDGRAALNAAKRGANSDITSITGLTTALATGQGGTGMGSPGASGNILISNGTIWNSSKPTGEWDIDISGNSATSNYADKAPLLSPQVAYSWKNADLPKKFSLGISNAFVRKEQGDDWFSYGSVLNMRTYDGGGGSLQLYVPYSPTFGGNALRVRFGNYDISDGNSWTAWKTLLASDNYNDYAPTKTGGGASGSWSINVTGSAGSATTAGDSTKWGGAVKFVQATTPTGGVNGDIWFKV